MKQDYYEELITTVEGMVGCWLRQEVACWEIGGMVYLHLGEELCIQRSYYWRQRYSSQITEESLEMIEVYNAALAFNPPAFWSETYCRQVEQLLQARTGSE